jgi:Zn-dependent protease with chaperone function
MAAVPALRATGGRTGAAPDLAGLPAATTWRFVLLIVTTLASALALNIFLLADLLQVFPGIPALGSRGCFTRLASDAAARRPGFGITFYNCLNSARLADGVTDVALTVLLVAVAVAIYRLYPWLVTRGVPMRTLSGLGDVVPEGVRGLVTRTADEAGRPVKVLVAIGRPGTGARAFGCFPRYRVLVDIGLITAADRDDGRLRAVLAHEIAHVRNRDIDITYLTTALWWAFLIVEVPLSIAADVRLPHSLLSESWRFAVALGVIWLVRSSVLRTREFYADLSAAREPTAAAPLRQVLDRARPRGAGTLAGITAVAAYHPTPRARLAVLDDPSPLARVWLTDSLAAGFLIGFAYSPVNLLVELFGIPYGWRVVVLGILVGLPVAGTLAAPLWRQVFQQLSVGQLPRDAWRCSVFLATGIVIGQLVTPPLAYVNGLLEILRSKPLEGLTLILILYLASYVLCEWIVLCAAVWLANAHTARLSYRIGAVITAIVFGAWLAYWFMTQSLLLAADTPWQVLELLGKAIPVEPYLQISLVLALIYPAVAWPRLRGDREGPDGPGRVVAVPVPAALALAVAIMVAATFIPFAFHGYLVAALAASIAQHDGVIVMLAVLKIFAVISAVAGFAVGALLGGRGTSRQAIAATGLAALVATPYVVWTTDVQWIDARYGWSSAQNYALSYAPGHLSGLETFLGWWFIDLAAAAMAASLIGAGIRAISRVGRRPGLPVRRSGRPRLLAGIADSLPGLVVGTAISFASLQPILGIGWDAPTAATSGIVTPAQILKSQPFPAHGSLTALVACEDIYATHNSLSGNLLTPNEIGVMDARTGAEAYASDNYILGGLGYSIYIAMRQGDEGQATELSAAANDLCLG